MPSGRARDMKRHVGATEKVPVTFPAVLARLIDQRWQDPSNDIENFSHCVRELLREALDEIETKSTAAQNLPQIPDGPQNGRRKEIILESVLKERVTKFRQRNKAHVPSVSGAICLLCYYGLTRGDKPNAKKK